jgi:hypothetical protein
MNPTHLSPNQGAQAQERRPWRGAGVLDTVKVAADTFRSVLFMSSEERKEFTTDQRPAKDKPQKRSAAGVPLWSVKVATVNWRGKTDLINVTVPMHDDPGTKFTAGQPVELVDLVFGVSPKRAGGFTTWASADSLAPATGV